MNNIEEYPKHLLEDIIFQEENSAFKIKDVNWKDIISVYEILLMLLNNQNSVKYFKILDNKFFQRVFDNISSFDNDERNITKLIIHKLYGCSFQFRTIIIKTFERKLLDILYGSNKLIDIIGINDILELLNVTILLTVVYIRWFK
jgi:hypothetical protein